MASTLESIVKYLKKEKIATAQELAKALDINIKTIRYWIKKGMKERALDLYPLARVGERGKKTVWGVILRERLKEYVKDLEKLSKNRKSSLKT
jgi:predicted transcriptional regulator